MSRDEFRFTDAEWTTYQRMPDQGISHRGHLEFVVNRWLTAHDAVVVREAKAEALREAKARCLAAAGWTGNATITFEQMAESLETLAVELEKGESA